MRHIFIFIVLLNLTSCDSSPPPPSEDPSINAGHADISDVHTDLFKSLYSIECNVRRDERRAIIEGNLTITNNAEVEKFRCIKHVKGNLIIDAEKLIPTPSNPYTDYPLAVKLIC